jgi:hypothetical protein
MVDHHAMGGGGEFFEWDPDTAPLPFVEALDHEEFEDAICFAVALPATLSKALYLAAFGQGVEVEDLLARVLAGALPREAQA